MAVELHLIIHVNTVIDASAIRGLKFCRKLHIVHFLYIYNYESKANSFQNEK